MVMSNKLYDQLKMKIIKIALIVILCLTMTLSLRKIKERREEENGCADGSGCKPACAKGYHCAQKTDSKGNVVIGGGCTCAQD